MRVTYYRVYRYLTTLAFSQTESMGIAVASNQYVGKNQMIPKIEVFHQAIRVNYLTH